MSQETAKQIAQAHVALAAWKLETATKGRTAAECKQLFTQLDGAINAVVSPTAQPGDLAAAVLSGPTGLSADRKQALTAICGRLQDLGRAFDGKQHKFADLDKMYTRVFPLNHRINYRRMLNGHSIEDLASYDERDCAVYQLGFVKQKFHSEVLNIKTPKAKRRPVRRHRQAGEEEENEDDDDFHGDDDGFFAAKQRQQLAREAAEIVDMLTADVQTADDGLRTSILEALARHSSGPADPEFRRFLADEVIASLMPILSGQTTVSSPATDTPLRDVALDVIRQQYPAATDDNLAHALKVVKAKGALLILDDDLDEASLLQSYEPAATNNTGGIAASVASLLWRGSSAGAADTLAPSTSTTASTATRTILPTFVDAALTGGTQIFRQEDESYEMFTYNKFFPVEIHSTRSNDLYDFTIRSLQDQWSMARNGGLSSFSVAACRFAQNAFVVLAKRKDNNADLMVYNYIAMWIKIRLCQLVEVASFVGSCCQLQSDNDPDALARFYAAGDKDGMAVLVDVLPVVIQMVDIWIDGLASLV